MLSKLETINSFLVDVLVSWCFSQLMF